MDQPSQLEQRLVTLEKELQTAHKRILLLECVIGALSEVECEVRLKNFEELQQRFTTLEKELQESNKYILKLEPEIIDGKHWRDGKWIL